LLVWTSPFNLESFLSNQAQTPALRATPRGPPAHQLGNDSLMLTVLPGFRGIPFSPQLQFFESFPVKNLPPVLPTLSHSQILFNSSACNPLFPMPSDYSLRFTPLSCPPTIPMIPILPFPIPPGLLPPQLCLSSHCVFFLSDVSRSSKVPLRSWRRPRFHAWPAALTNPPLKAFPFAPQVVPCGKSWQNVADIFYFLFPSPPLSPASLSLPPTGHSARIQKRL